MNIYQLLATPVIGNAMSDHDLLNGLPLIIWDQSNSKEIRRQAWDKLNEVVGENDPFGGQIYVEFMAENVEGIDGWVLDSQDGGDLIWFPTKETAEDELKGWLDEGQNLLSARIDQIDYHWGKQTMDEVKADPEAIEWMENLKNATING